MTQFVKFTHGLVLVLIGIIIILQGQPSLTQGNVTILCDANFDLSQISVPATFPGVFYSDISRPSDNIPYRFERIDQTGGTTFDAPLSPNPLLSSPLVSPSNRFMAFRPYDGINLTVWDMITGEVATLPLAPEEFAMIDERYLYEDFNYERHLSRMIWRDNNHLLLRGFPENQHDKEFTTTLEITVNASPLSLSKGTLTNVNYPALPPPPNMISEQVFLSPQGTYAVQLATVPVQGIQPQQYLRVFDVNTLQVVAELVPSRTFHAVGPPTWSQDENRLFIGTRSEENDNFQSEFGEVNLSTGQVNTGLWTALENAVGANIETSSLRAVFSPDGNNFAFEIFGADQNQSYMVIYHLPTGGITAICDQYRISNSGALHTFWSPDGQYVGYWASGNVLIFNIQTGDTHLLSNNSQNFVGWVSSP
ncbi:MAG: hypothetical protein SF029_07680 [bacterium]|nr:hypothetical protein [bacterium]